MAVPSDKSYWEAAINQSTWDTNQTQIPYLTILKAWLHRELHGLDFVLPSLHERARRHFFFLNKVNVNYLDFRNLKHPWTKWKHLGFWKFGEEDAKFSAASIICIIRNSKKKKKIQLVRMRRKLRGKNRVTFFPHCPGAPHLLFQRILISVMLASPSN